mmetsp:Transcript_105480/g.278565  ORF Transcript_105480/g.278565 Transcript_105480/m.278565 type:complete len:236 (-) Transcript_105480:165-872(-)
MLAQGRGTGRAELFEVQRAHVVEGHLAARALAELEEGSLQRPAPREAKVPGLVRFHLVHGVQARGRVLEALASAEVVHPGNRHRHHPAEHRQVCVRDLLNGVGLGAVQAWVDEVRLHDAAFHEDAVVQHRLVEGGLHLSVHLDRGLERVRALHHDVGLHDGHDTLVLADQSVPGEVLHVGPDRQVRRAPVLCDRQRAPPFREFAARRLVLRAAGGQRVEALHDGVAAGTGERVHL